MKKAGRARARTKKSRQNFGKTHDFVTIGLKLFDFEENIFSKDSVDASHFLFFLFLKWFSNHRSHWIQVHAWMSGNKCTELKRKQGISHNTALTSGFFDSARTLNIVLDFSPQSEHSSTIIAKITLSRCNFSNNWFFEVWPYGYVESNVGIFIVPTP